ncbi:Putative SAC domain-containing protein [Septoria linicola]|uniref:SAC domain-containing protein n=1 Tax=Septoria linicola TaxID=215465 RepID=A0A9Q9AJD1_9PEZI|nr:Putative SAC domain-containing protein [Septoria linicola]
MSATLPFRDINVHASSTYYAFSSPSSPNAPTLLIDRPSGDIRLNDRKVTGGHRVSSISGILGIIKLRLDSYIIVITKSQAVGRLKGHQIYKVVATEFLPLRERQVHDPDEDTYLAYLKTLLKNGPMYFSYSFDLTNSFQRQATSDANKPLWERADDRFFWNRFISSSLINLRLGKSAGRLSSGPQPAVDPYILPVMYGMMRITNTSIKGNALTFVLITRRSRFRTGTRYLSRGIDEEGHVSNYNETEQSVILNDTLSSGMTSYAGDGGFGNGKPVSGSETQVLSYVQTRGSVPVYWAEVNTLKYTPKLQIRGVETAVNAARRHFDEQIRLYGENYMVNLVNQKGREMRVKDAYEQLVKILQTHPTEYQEADQKTREKFDVIEPDDQRSWYDHLHYVYFDFHNETKGLKWHRAQLLLDQLADGLTAGGYFHGIDRPSGGVDIRRKQTAVVRTNCMDCLDRTNVVQSMLGRWTLTRMLIDLGVLKSGETAQDDQTFEHLFRNVWADNADVVSKTYSGTGALKTDFTRTGNRTRAGMLQDLSNSCTRYVRNNFADGPRQDAFDLFLGHYSPDTAGIGSLQQFADRRPLVVQAVPYVLGFCVFFVAVSVSTNRLPNSTVWPLRLFTLFSLAVAGYTGRFMWSYGTLYVNWPKLNTPQWAVEAYQDTLDKVAKDPLLGAFIGGGGRDARLGTLEEGKKRRE